MLIYYYLNKNNKESKPLLTSLMLGIDVLKQLCIHSESEYLELSHHLIFNYCDN